MGLGQKFGGKNRGKHGKAKKERQKKVDYKEIIMENTSLEKYYTGNGVIPESEREDFFSAMRKPLPLSFRVTGFTDEARVLLDNMKTQHLKNIESIVLDNGKTVTPAEPVKWYPGELAWRTNLNRTELRKFRQLAGFHQWLISEAESGHVTRQELVSMIPTLLLDVKSHHAVLDMCAAPGSKTSQIIEALHTNTEEGQIPSGFCVANDANNARCYMLVHQAKRLNSPCCLVVNHDAQGMPNMKVNTDVPGEYEWLEYDRILADVPCSGDGTLRKNPDVWNTWKYKNTLSLHAMQLRIAQRGLELLKVGGKMVYSTCSMSPIEDEAVVAALIAKCEGSIRLVNIEGKLPTLKYSKGVSSWPVFHEDTFYTKYEDCKKFDITKDTMFPPEGAENMNLDYCMRLLPHHADTGGFFVAVLEKVDKLPWMRSEVRKCPAPAEKKDGVEPPKKKPRTWRRGTFNEDPFIFMDEQDENLKNLRSYYDLKPEFPLNQVFNRLRPEKQSTSQCRNLFFVNRKIRELLQYNVDVIKFINSGVRIFSRTEAKCHDAQYRVTQDGINTMRHFCQNQNVTIDAVDDLTYLLNEENPDISKVGSALKEKIWAESKPGPFIINYVPKENAKVDCKFSVIGWRGQNSLRLYIGKHDRVHFLHLIGEELPPWLQMQTNTRRQRQEMNQKKEAGEETTREETTNGNETKEATNDESENKTE